MTRYVQIEIPADLAIEDLARAARELRCTIRISAGGLRLVPITREPVAPIRFLPVNADTQFGFVRATVISNTAYKGDSHERC